MSKNSYNKNLVTAIKIKYSFFLCYKKKIVIQTKIFFFIIINKSSEMSK